MRFLHFGVATIDPLRLDDPLDVLPETNRHLERREPPVRRMRETQDAVKLDLPRTTGDLHLPTLVPLAGR
jgi:hypothetical protein